MAQQVQEVTEQNVELAYVDQGYTGRKAAEAAAAHGIALEVVKLAEAKRGFVLLPRRWHHPGAFEVEPPPPSKPRHLQQPLGKLRGPAAVACGGGVRSGARFHIAKEAMRAVRTRLDR